MLSHLYQRKSQVPTSPPSISLYISLSHREANKAEMGMELKKPKEKKKGGRAVEDKKQKSPVTKKSKGIRSHCTPFSAGVTGFIARTVGVV